MSEKPTFCPRCKRMHVGVCVEAVEPRQTIFPGSSKGRIPDFESGDAGSTPAPGTKFEIGGRVTLKGTEQNVPSNKFDKRAYQRDYMRRYRAGKK